MSNAGEKKRGFRGEQVGEGGPQYLSNVSVMLSYCIMSYVVYIYFLHIHLMYPDCACCELMELPWCPFPAFTQLLQACG